MKAWVLHNIGDIRFEDVDIPRIGDNEVLVAVKAAGICGSDIPRIYETGAHNMPLIPGHEFSGKVVETGKSVDPKWIDKRVGIFPLIPCKQCEMCRKKLYEMCRNYNYLGSRCNGGFAEYCAVPANNLIELPDRVTYEQAAMLEPMSVAVHAIRRVNLNKNDTVVVHGLGTIGLLIVMFLCNMGFENILAIGNKDCQKDMVMKLGLPSDSYCNCKNESIGKFISHKTKCGADVYFECVGKNETINDAVENTAPAGKIVFVGNPYSDILHNKYVYWKILRNQLTVTGTWNSTFTHDKNDDWNYAINKLTEGKINPEAIITHRLSLDYMKLGIKNMKEKRVDYIKIIISIL